MPVLARLMEVGVLPPVTPQRNESIYGLLHRLGGQSSPLEFLPLNLTWYRQQEYGHEDAQPRSPHELVLTLEHQPGCQAWTCLEARDELRELHPWLLGSLLYHVSVLSQTTYPIYTVRDAIEDEELWSFEGDIRGFWKSLCSEFRHDQGRAPTRQELRDYAADQRGKTPRDVLNLFGQEEWVPILSQRRRLSLEDIVRVCEARPERVWARRTLDLVNDLVQLREVELALQDLATEDDVAGMLGSGEARKNPVAVISASVSGSRVHLHAVQERLEETWEMAAQTSGFFDNLLVRLNAEEDAPRAAQVLRLHARAWSLVQDIVARLIDNDE